MCSLKSLSLLYRLTKEHLEVYHQKNFKLLRNEFTDARIFADKYEVIMSYSSLIMHEMMSWD
jgi:hypothetical protein